MIYDTEGIYFMLPGGISRTPTKIVVLHTLWTNPAQAYDNKYICVQRIQ